MSYTSALLNKKLITPPRFLEGSVKYEVLTGSQAYGIANQDSDWDIYGFCIPPKELIFPHLAGEIPGFGEQVMRFEQFQKHGIESPEEGRIYDITIFSIVKYFQLCMLNNPNILDTLFIPPSNILSTSEVAKHLRSNRKMFLHKGAWHKYKGFAYSQLHKLNIKNPEGNRKELVEKYGYDTKFATHIVRLMGNIEQILIEGDLDLQRNKEQLKSVKRGEWTKQEVETYFSKKEIALEQLYLDSKLQHSPNEAKIKNLLLECLEMQFGNLSDVVLVPGRAEQTLREVWEVLKSHGYK